MSKRILHHPEVPANETTVSWRSPGQLEDTAEFRQWLDREFPQGAAEMDNPDDAENSRRTFLKLMGASTALAGFGMAACRRPESYIVPFTKAPEWVIPGKATYYASSMPRAHGATPLVVTSFEGRPTKLAPNSLHPDAEGTDLFAQASILDLYSPSRSTRILKSGKPAKRSELEEVIAGIAKNRYANIGFLFGADDSPTRARLTRELGAKFSMAKFYRYEALADEMSSAALGDGVKLVADFNLADRIVSLDCDFAMSDPQGPVTPFFDRRKPEGKSYEFKPDESKLNRLYAIEPVYSLTGGMADHRLRVSPSQVNAIAAQIARALGVKIGAAIVAPELSDPKQVAWVNALVDDLKANAGKSAVLAGSRQSLSVHLLAHAINVALGNIGEGKPLLAVQTETQGLGSLAKLKADIDANVIDTLVILTPSNPLYDAPADLSLAETFAKVATTIQLGTRSHATAHAATWHIPATHYLESWSDARSARGVYTMVQPLILPLYKDCVSEIELLLTLLSEEGKLLTGGDTQESASPAMAAVRATFEAMGGAGDEAWRALLRDGFLAGSSYPVVTPELREIAAPLVATTPSPQSLEVVFSTDYSVFDGRWIDNGWLQEAPDPITKLTWDNAALIAPQTAKDLGIYDQIISPEPESSVLGVKSKFAKVGPDGEGEHRKSPVIKLEVNGRSLEIPVLISFGQAENTVVIPLGYGQGFNKHDELKRSTEHQAHVGLVGVNSGFNAYPLRTSGTPYFATGAKVSKTGLRYSMALTQEHSAMYGRALAREISTMEDEVKGNFLAQLKDVPKQGNDSHAPPNVSLYKPQTSATWQPDKDGKAAPLISDPLHQWGMSIDLSSCMGCNSCLVACQAENNIPIVGKNEVARGREMHWIRMDRYFATQKDNSFDPNNPELIPQPVTCMQCEMAPCETVCPVNATVHTEDGLNAMAYNRCIGTRYCANNCPYKVRRFNYFDYNKRNPLIEKNLYKGPFGETQTGEAPHLQKNPNVTVRMRGVMEKCTFCVQRLKDSVIRQKRGQKQEALVAGKSSTQMELNETTLRIPVDSVKTACQEACPAHAITFGNLLDQENSEMGRSKMIDRNYSLLNYLNTRPRISYLARVKNPNPAMPDAKFVGKATVHMV
jgi:MoCo/4Fe-4S cofactor protein with predicted Tat translocation signal